MQENKNVIFKTLRLTTLFLSVFLAVMFALVAGKALTFQFMGSASVWGIELLFVSFVIFLAFISTIFLKKFKFLALIASLAGLFVLIFLSLKPLSSPLDLWLKIPSLTLLWLLLKHTFLPFFGLFTTIFVIKKDEETAGIAALSILLCLILYPFMYEKSITLTQSLTLCALAYGVITVLNIFLLFDKKEQEDTKEELPKTYTEVLKPLGLGALLGALFIGYTNHLTFNLVSTPAVWAFGLLAFGAGAYLAYTKGKWTQNRHALVALWISLLMVIIFRMREFTYLENPCLNTLLALFSLFAFSWFLWGEVLMKKGKNKSFWALIILGATAGMVFQNALIPLIFKVYIDYVVLNFILYSFAFFIFCVSFVRGKDFGEDVIKKSMLTLSLSIVVIFAFFVQESTPYLELSTRNFWGINTVITNRISGAKEFYSNQRLVSLQNYGLKTLDYTMNPLGYYGSNSGFYYVYEGMKNWETTKNRPLLIAKIGMEGGGINGYLSSSDKIIYYDVNPQAQELANKFAYMKLTRGEVEFKPGNPRINLKNEKAKFDIIFIDLSVQQGDSAYLITKEALDLYKSKLKKDGIIIFNTTSKNFNYRKVLTKYANDNSLRHSHFVARYPEKYVDNFDNTSFIIFGGKNKIYKRFKDFATVQKGVEAFDSVNIIKTMRREFNDNNSSILPLFRFTGKIVQRT